MAATFEGAFGNLEATTHSATLPEWRRLSSSSATASVIVRGQNTNRPFLIDRFKGILCRDYL